MGSIDAEEYMQIVELLHAHSGNQNKVAGLCGRHQTTVRKIAKTEGIESINAAPKRANEVRRDYSQVERLELLNEGFEKARELLKTIQDPRELQAWMVAVATAIDKRRLEDGQATSREEKVDPERRKRIKESLDELAEQRRKRMG